jgi:hypothetical protein
MTEQHFFGCKVFDDFCTSAKYQAKVGGPVFVDEKVMSFCRLHHT